MKKWISILGIAPIFLISNPEIADQLAAPLEEKAAEPSESELAQAPAPSQTTVKQTPAAPAEEKAAEASAPEKPEFWSTGPLIIPPNDIIDFGHFNYEPYLYWTQFKDTYDAHWKSVSSPLFTSVIFQPLIRAGIFPRGELDIYPTVTYNNTEHVHDWVWGDMPFSLNIQVLEDDPDHWYHPLTWVGLLAVAPWGKYEKLKPSKLGTDIGGTGSWLPGVSLSLYHEFYIYGPHYLSVQSYFSFQYGSPVHVKGLNFYGGDEDTRGKVFPGDITQAIVSFQYSLSHRWVLALDNVYTHTNKTRFKGDTSPDAPMTSPSSETFSMAPALEYLWNENFGIVGGAWFTVAGRNTDQFVSGVIAIYINK